MTTDNMRDDQPNLRETVWNGIKLRLPQPYYQIAMAHVEEMRQASESSDVLNSEDDPDGFYLDSNGWKLSDTLTMALEEGRNHIEKLDASPEEFILRGLRQFERDLNLPGCCVDEDADDVFTD